MPGIGVISNPRSGRNRRNPRLVRRLAYVLGEKGELAQPGGLPDLAEVARNFKDRDIDVLCINGGDGTIHTVLSAFYREYGDSPLPLIALLRGGTMNTVAGGLGIKGTPEDLLGQVVTRYHADEPFALAERNLMVVDDGTGQLKVGFLFGNGLVSSFLEAYYEGGNPSPWKAVKVLARTVLSALVRGGFARRLTQPVRCRATVDGQVWEPQQYLSITAATVDDLGLQFRPFHKVVRHPGRVQVIGWCCRIVDIALALPRIRLAKPVVREDVLDVLARGMLIEGEGARAYILDGDFHRGTDRLRLDVGPRVRLIVG